MNLKKPLFISLFVCFLFLNSFTSNSQSLPSGMKIWFNLPAATWNDALPV